MDEGKIFFWTNSFLGNRLEQLLGDRSEQTHVLCTSDRQPGEGEDQYYDNPDHGFVGDDNETRPVYGVVVDDGDNRGKHLVKLGQPGTTIMVTGYRL